MHLPKKSSFLGQWSNSQQMKAVLVEQMQVPSSEISAANVQNSQQWGDGVDRAFREGDKTNPCTLFFFSLLFSGLIDRLIANTLNPLLMKTVFLASVKFRVCICQIHHLQNLATLGSHRSAFHNELKSSLLHIHAKKASFVLESKTGGFHSKK